MLSRLRLLLVAEQRRLLIGEPDERAAIMHHQFVPLDQQLQANTLFDRGPAVAE